MKASKKFTAELVLAAMISGVIGCGNGASKEEQEATAINEYVEELGKLDVVSAFADVQVIATDVDSASPGGPLLCDQSEINEVRLFEQFTSQGTSARTLYPGMLLDGSGLSKGIFNEIPLAKKPMTISTTLAAGAASAVMENPSLSEFGKRRSEMLLPLIEQFPGTVTGRKTKVALSVENEDELSLTLGFDVKAGLVTSVDVASQFDFNSQTTRSRYLLRILEEFYTVAIDKPAFASDYFDESVSFNDVQQAFRSGQPPVYIDSITYGRAIYVAVESDFSASELAAALNATINSQLADGTLEFGLTKEEVLSRSTIRGVAIGGVADDIEDLGNIQDPEVIASLASRVVEVSETAVGEPISFTVSYLADNTKTSANVSGSFGVENCRVVPVDPVNPINDVKVDVNQMVVTFLNDGPNDGSGEIFGTISASYRGRRVELFNRQRSAPASMSVGPVTSDLFKSGTLDDVDTSSNDPITIEVNLVEADSSGDDPIINSFDVSMAEVLNGEGRVEIDDSVDGATKFKANMFIGFAID